MKKKLSKPECDVLIPEIKRVLETGKRWEDEQLHHPVGVITEAILAIPGMERSPLEDARYGIDGFDTNGWQWDWWQYFTYQGRKYVLSGSGFYGGHSFALSEDER